MKLNSFKPSIRYSCVALSFVIFVHLVFIANKTFALNEYGRQTDDIIYFQEWPSYTISFVYFGYFIASLLMIFAIIPDNKKK